jgi:tetratricopeptide (TPR) repeat protein
MELSIALRVAGEAKRAVTLAEEIRQRVAALAPPQPHLLIDANYHLAMAYLVAGEYAKAKPLLAERMAHFQKVAPPGHWRTDEASGLLALCELRLGNLDAAEKRARECVALRKASVPDKWPYFAAASLLGDVLLARKKLDEAEPLLKSGYEGLKAQENTFKVTERWQLAEAAGRLARFYEAKGDKTKSEEWKNIEEKERR